jgi:sirohydrochlorin cobaltochelatase
VDALILFAHGSRDPVWRAPFDRIAERVRAQRPDARVVVAFMEYASPSLPEAVAALAAQGATRIRVAPLFLGLGGHLRHDLPAIVDAARAQSPHVKLELTPSLGESDDVLGAMAAWLAALA